ncbi:hypothetical protein GKODMF_07310 [Candidatus Electrothrix gigas]
MKVLRGFHTLLSLPSGEEWELYKRAAYQTTLILKQDQ